MSEFHVSWPVENILQAKTKKDLRTGLGIVISPIFCIIVWFSTVYILGWAFWKFGTTQLPPDAFSVSFWAERQKVGLLVLSLTLAAIALLIFATVFTWKVIKNAKRRWQIQRAPEAKDYGVVEGFHYGDGTVNLLEQGISLHRSFIDLFIDWGVINEIYQDGVVIGIFDKTGAKVVFGNTENEVMAQQFLEMSCQTLNERRVGNDN